jgi:hypothetical protein
MIGCSVPTNNGHAQGAAYNVAGTGHAEAGVTGCHVGVQLMPKEGSTQERKRTARGACLLLKTKEL